MGVGDIPQAVLMGLLLAAHCGACGAGKKETRGWKQFRFTQRSLVCGSRGFACDE